MTLELNPTLEILATARRRSLALVQRDVATVDSLLSADFVYTNASGAVLNKESYLQRYVLDADVSWISQEILESRVVFFGDTAVFIARIHDVALFGTYALNAVFRTTQVYRLIHGCWMYVVGHTSLIEDETA